MGIDRYDAVVVLGHRPRELGLELFGLSVVTTREGTGEAIDPDLVVAEAAAAAGRLGVVLAAVVRLS